MNTQPAPTPDGFEFEGDGPLSVLGLEYQTSFRATVDSLGKFQAHVSIPLDKDNAAHLLDAVYGKGLTVPWFGLRGLTPQGVRIESDYLHWTSARTGSDAQGRTTEELTLAASQVDVIWPRGPDAPGSELVVEYLVPGMLGFSVDRIGTPFGELAVAAPPKLDDYESLSGRLLFSCAREIREQELDDFVERTLEVISFAQGATLGWTARKTYMGGTLGTLRLEPTSWAPEPRFPVFSQLDLAPVLKLAVQSYTEALREAGLRVAMTWMLMPSRYREAEFVLGMTALEHLVSKSPVEEKIVAKGSFRANIFRPLLATLEALRERDVISHEQCEAFRKKVVDLNRRPFADRLSAMLAMEDVPMAGLENAVPTLTGIRNKIVHRGEAPPSVADDEGLLRPLATLRELLTRIVLHRLGHQGNYFTYVNGQAWASFPPSSNDVSRPLNDSA